jgi:hypothetical protein
MKDAGFRTIIAKAASYTLGVGDLSRSGLIFTTRGAGGAVTFTLPTPTTGQKIGYWVEFHNLVDQNMVVTAASGKAICDGNAAATSLTASTGSHKIGAKIRAEWNGVAWYLSGRNVGVTYTVA